MKKMESTYIIIKDKLGNNKTLEAKPVPDSIPKLRAAIDGQRSDYIALRLNNQQIYGERAASYRDAIWVSNKVEIIWQGFEKTLIILSPDKERTETVRFVFDEELKKTISKNKEPLDYARLPNFKINKEDVRPSERLDFYYYKDREKVKDLSDWPTLDSICEHIKYGYHANPHRDSPDAGKAGEKMKFIGMTNISPHGYLIGELPVKTLKELPPKSSIVYTGDFVVSLFGGNLKKRTLGAIGKAAIVDKKHSPAFINQTMASMKLKRDYNPYFILLSLRAEYFQEQLLRVMKPASSAQTQVTLKDFRQCRVKTPDKKTMDKLGQEYQELINSFKNEASLLRDIEKL
ncbi:MAG: restriction endonuclease subunit S [Desulfobacteraceae bacterium]|nr:restriction endonuclease subunit S [Desulfobacteraceae bacterium]